MKRVARSGTARNPAWTRPDLPQRRHSPPAAKQPFNIHHVIHLLRKFVAPFPPAAMFALKDHGYSTLFQQLVGCIISIRTRDETSLPVALALLAKAPTPAALLALSPAQLDALLRPATFHRPKAATLRTIAQAAVNDYQGELPCDREALLALPGVGPKCASLALGIACGQPYISVDVHVHRIVNRWGYVAASTPEKTMLALMQKLPRAYWVELNRLLVPFGKHHCTAAAPRCSTCPLLSMCRQIGVSAHR
jgi:endonuclease-3